MGPLCWFMLQQLGVPLNIGKLSLSSLLLSGLLYPILEEFIFRGGLQSELHKREKLSRSVVGLSLANVITSTVFAAMHLFNQPPLWAALVFFPSLVFGWTRDRYGNIQAAIMLHSTYNAGFILLFS